MSRTLADLFDASEIDRFCDIQNSCGIQLNFRLSSPPFAAPKSNIQNPSAVTTSSATVFNNAVNEDEFIRQSLFSFPSSNVGYNNTAARGNLNWYAPCFRSIGMNTTDINDIQLNDDGAGTVGWGDSMQVVGPLGNASEMYFYYDKTVHPSGEATSNYWGDDTGAPVEISFDEGDGIAIDNPNELQFTIVGAGEVSTNTVTFSARENLNWSGNPFPSVIDINAVQLNDDGAGTVGWGDSMQIVGPLGNASEMYFYYDKTVHPSGEATSNYWGDDTGTPVEVSLQPGAGFAIDNPNGLEFTVEIAYK